MSKRMRMPMPTVRKRSDVVWIALALALGAGGAAFATSSAGAGSGGGGANNTIPITAITDPALTSTDPAASDTATELSHLAGVSRDASAPQAWSVGDHAVVGYRADDGRFCFEFVELTGGCLSAGALRDEQPLDVTVDHGPSTFRVYGLALDGVVAVAVRVGGQVRQADFAHNAFSFSDDALGATSASSGELVATMSDGTSRTQTFPIASLDAP
jgi:hypothetical protein